MMRKSVKTSYLGSGADMYCETCEAEFSGPECLAVAEMHATQFAHIVYYTASQTYIIETAPAKLRLVEKCPAITQNTR